MADALDIERLKTDENYRRERLAMARKAKAKDEAAKLRAAIERQPEDNNMDQPPQRRVMSEVEMQPWQAWLDHNVQKAFEKHVKDVLDPAFELIGKEMARTNRIEHDVLFLGSILRGIKPLVKDSLTDQKSLEPIRNELDALRTLIDDKEESQ